jgi:hypothetical protein
MKCLQREDGLGELVRTSHVCTYIHTCIKIHRTHTHKKKTHTHTTHTHTHTHTHTQFYTHTHLYTQTHTHRHRHTDISMCITALETCVGATGAFPSPSNGGCCGCHGCWGAPPHPPPCVRRSHASLSSASLGEKF